jgi:hypothetical protein
MSAVVLRRGNMAVFNDNPAERWASGPVPSLAVKSPVADPPTADALIKALSAAVDTDMEVEAARAEMSAAERIWRSRESDRDVMWADYNALLVAYKAAHP